jgi:aspartate aminotransferase
MRAVFRERRDYLVELLTQELGLTPVIPEGAFYTMVDTRAYGSSLMVAEALLEQGVITVPGAAFGKECEGFLRVSFCADKPVLAEGVRRIDKALSRLQQAS